MKEDNINALLRIYGQVLMPTLFGRGNETKELLEALETKIKAAGAHMLTNLPDVSVARENAVRFMSSTPFNGQACNVHDIYFNPQANKYYVGKWKSQFKGRLNSGTGKILQYLAQHIDEKIWEGELQLVTGWKNPRFQIQDLRSQMHVSSYYSIHARQDPFDIIYISLNRDKGR